MSYNPYSPVPPFQRPIDDPLQNAWANVVTPTGGQQQQGGGYAGSGISTMNPYAPQDATNAQNQMNAINAAGPDVFDRAMGSVRDQRRQMLDAIAGAGSAGKAEYQRMASMASERQQTQLSQALNEARTRNADPGTIDSITRGINQTYDEATSSRDAQSANWQGLFDAMGLANDAYFTQYGNTLPLIQQQFKNDLATNFATNRAGAMTEIEKGRQSTSLSLAQIQMQERQRQEDIAREEAQNAIENQHWQSTFDENQREWKAQFDEDARRYGLDYALKQQAARSSGGSGGGGGGGSSSGGFLNLGLGNKGEAVSQLLSGIGAGANRLNTSGSPRSANAAEQMTHPQFISQLLDQQQGLPVGTIYNAIGGDKAFKVPALPPSPAGAPVQQVFNLAVEGFQLGLSLDQVRQKLMNDFGASSGVVDAINRAMAQARPGSLGSAMARQSGPVW